MLAQIKRQDLRSEQLSWLCIEPAILEIKGKSAKVKNEAYKQLNAGQRALYMFYVFHNHTRTITEFYWFASYLIGDLKGWNTIKRDILFFEDHEMLELYEEIELLAESKNRLDDGTWREALASDLEKDTELLVTTKRLYEKYLLHAPETIHRMNAYINEHSNDFLLLSDG